MATVTEDNKTEIKRGGPDPWVKAIQFCGVLSWFLLIVALWVIDRARPRQANLLDKRWDFQVRESWDGDMARLAFQFAVANLVLCLLGLFMNSRRHRRSDDRYSRSLMINACLSLFGILLFVVFA